jgi:hypothetical protein
MKTTVILAFLCCSLFLFAACKKKDNDNNSGFTRAQTLEAGKWQLSSYTGTVNYMGQDTTADFYSQMADCDKDDFLLFAADGTGTLDENTNKCANDPQIEHFGWILLDNDTRLLLIDSNPDTFDVAELTNTQMVLRLVKPNSSGVPVTFISTYKNIQ